MDIVELSYDTRLFDSSGTHPKTINNTIDVEGLTNHKNDSDESDATVNDEVLLPLLKECKNREGFRLFLFLRAVTVPMSSSDGSGEFNGSDATTSSLR
uniref:Uncharacterized protein n=1 Tax=Timema shepardi TaxID=629360 RepID=A0A7R9AUF2_TIMSH|nr:unnamed protein product [Timema shepardi]